MNRKTVSKKACENCISRGTLLYIIDVLMGLSFIAAFVTGIIKFPGFFKLIGITTSPAFPWKAISRLHDLSGLVMGLLVIVHIIMHWSWLVAMTKKIFTKQKD